MSSFPQHVENIEKLNVLGFDVSEYYEDGKVSIDSWSYDEQVEILSIVIQRIFITSKKCKEMENAIKAVMRHKNGSFPMLGNLNDNDLSRIALDELERTVLHT